MTRNPLIVALDVPTADKALGLAQALAPFVGAFKVGSELFTSAGPEVVRQIRAAGGSIFLDLKFHDIPNTVKGSVAAATRLDVQMLTVHCGGGLEMLKAAEAAAQQTAAEMVRPAPLVLGVTVLTSLDEDALARLGVTESLSRHAERLADLAVDAGLRGLVCSPLELPLLRRRLPQHVQLVTPGIRAAHDVNADQKRTLSAAEAIAAGADWLVVGRPICAVADPRAAAQQILASINAAS
ncbi:MAG: orotidine-5'-phosphate decarboxylase [Verrucomicrobia subdivision 3 bacterium]|nr:orotidine-5'-phosphate decarboxylase [Limisphaerales bacterium]